MLTSSKLKSWYLKPVPGSLTMSMSWYPTAAYEKQAGPKSWQPKAAPNLQDQAPVSSAWASISNGLRPDSFSETVFGEDANLSFPSSGLCGRWE